MRSLVSTGPHRFRPRLTSLEDAVQQFQVNTNEDSAEFRRAGGAYDQRDYQVRNPTRFITPSQRNKAFIIRDIRNQARFNPLALLLHAPATARQTKIYLLWNHRDTNLVLLLSVQPILPSWPIFGI